MSKSNGSEAVGTDYPGAYPNSKKVYVEGTRGIAVPMREIQLSGGEPPLRVYDTSGPGDLDVRKGLPPLREQWIQELGTHETGRTRELSADVETPDALKRRTVRGSGSVTQMPHARNGAITPDIEVVAIREGV